MNSASLVKYNKNTSNFSVLALFRSVSVRWESVDFLSPKLVIFS